MLIRGVEKRTIAIQSGNVMEYLGNGKYSIFSDDRTTITFSAPVGEKINPIAGVSKITVIEEGVVVVELENGDVVSSQGEQSVIKIDLKPLAKVGSDLDSIYKELNEYIQLQSKETQLKIYSLFETILDMAVDHEELQEEFDLKINELYSYFDYDEIVSSMLENGSIKHPELKDKYGIEEPDNGITYITRDYLELCAFAVYLRPMSIIWCSLMDCLPTTLKNNDKKRELHLLKMANSYDCLKHPVMDRLDRYVTTLANDNKVSLGAIMDGLGSEDLKPWLMGFTLLRRVSFFQFTRVEEAKPNSVPANIVSSIYNFLINKITTAVSSFGTSYRHKRMKRMHGTDGDKTASFGDNYKITDEVTEGTIAFYDRAVMMPEQYLNIEPELNLKALEKRFKENSKAFDADDIDFENYILPQFVLDEIIPLRILPSLSLDGSGQQTLMAFTATQMILEHWGLYDLASLVLAKSTKIPYNKTYDNIKSRLTYELSQKLEELYPVIIVREKEKDRLNEGAKSIDSIAMEWGNKLWHPYISKVCLGKTTLKEISNGFLIHKEIRNDLAKLFIKLNKGN